jgi:hypothetical protein
MGIYLYSRVPNQSFEWQIKEATELHILGKGVILMVDCRDFTRRDKYCPFNSGDFVTFGDKRYYIRGIEKQPHHHLAGLVVTEVQNKSHEYRLRRQNLC